MCQKRILTSSLSIWQCQFCRSICFSGCICFIISRIASLAHWWWRSAQLKWFFTVWYYRQRWFSYADQVVEYVYISFDCWFILVLFVTSCLIGCCFTWIQGICCFGHSDLMNYNFSLSASCFYSVVDTLCISNYIMLTESDILNHLLYDWQGIKN